MNMRKMLLLILGTMLVSVGINACRTGTAMDIVLAEASSRMNYYPIEHGLYETWTNQRMAQEIDDIINDKQGVKVDVHSFGARGDGMADDTRPIQEAINEAAAMGGKVIIPAGVYLINAVASINLKDNVTIVMSPQAVLQAKPNSSEKYAILNLVNVHNVSIYGGILKGERSRHKGKGGEWGMGLRIIGSTNVQVKYTKANDCWGDGFYLGGNAAQNYCENVRLSNVSADNNRRQGISLISGKNIDIVNARLSNTEGTAPSAGLDIEPNSRTQILQNINLTNITTFNNYSSGILLSLHKLDGSKNAHSIYIYNHQDYGSGQGLVFNNRGAAFRGELVIKDSEWYGAQRSGAQISNHNGKLFNIKVINSTSHVL